MFKPALCWWKLVRLNFSPTRTPFRHRKAVENVTLFFRLILQDTLSSPTDDTEGRNVTRKAEDDAGPRILVGLCFVENWGNLWTPTAKRREERVFFRFY